MRIRSKLILEMGKRLTGPFGREGKDTCLAQAHRKRPAGVSAEPSARAPPREGLCAQGLDITWEMQLPRVNLQSWPQGVLLLIGTPSPSQGHRGSKTLNKVRVVINRGSANADVVWPSSFLTQII